jgi:putative ABC transport system ATP-binding protein
MSILSLRDVIYTYRGKYQTQRVLRGVNCAFETSTIYAVVGKSGSGKSTMLSLMAGLDLPQEGDVLFREQTTRSLNLDAYRRNDVAMIYQSFRLFPLLTAVENVMYPMELHGVAPKEAKKRAEELILRVDLPETVFTRFPSMLSGGEQQRVAIARALAMETELILADEPTGNLDGESSRIVIDLLRRLAHEQGYCVVVVTHDMGVLDRMDVIYRMRDGVVERMEYESVL